LKGIIQYKLLNFFILAPLEMSGHTQAITIVHDDSDNDEDDDYGLSDGEQDLAMSSADKASVVSFVDSADLTEITLVKGCSVIKAKKICSLRPFSTWMDLVQYEINLELG
jgi:hypothetical protein